MLDCVRFVKLHQSTEERTDQLYVHFVLWEVSNSFDVLLPVEGKIDDSCCRAAESKLYLLFELWACHNDTSSFFIAKNIAYLFIKHVFSIILIDVDVLSFFVDLVSKNEILLFNRCRKQQVVKIIIFVKVSVRRLDSKIEVLGIDKVTDIDETIFEEL